jgi:hypothetical protein
MQFIPVFFLLFSVLFGSDAPGMDRTGTYQDGSCTVTLQDISEKEYNSADDLAAVARENAYEQLEKDSGIFYFMHDSTLVLKFINGETKSFTDNKNGQGEDYIEYQYQGQVGNTGYSLMIISGDEYYGHTMINDTTGEETDLWDSPVLSPENDLIAAAYEQNAMDGIPGGIQLWNCKNGLMNIFEMRCNKWSPAEIKWIDDTTVLIKQTGDPEDVRDTKVTYTRMKIQREN